MKNNFVNNLLIKVKKMDMMNVIFILVTVIIFIALSTYLENFLSLRNIFNIFKQVSALGVLAIGITPVLLIGKIDLSLAIIMANATIFGGTVMQVTNNPFLGVLVMLLTGVSIGAFNGFFIAKVKVVDFIVTLSVMIFGMGFATWFTLKGSISIGLQSFIYIGQGKVLGFIPISFIIFLAIAAVVHLFLNYHYIGKWLVAMGTNIKASRLVGIKTENIIFLVFIFSGLMAGVAGVIKSAQLATGASRIGQTSVILDYIGAAAIGGVSLKGGKGSVLNAVVGTFILIIFTNAINILQVGIFTEKIVKGAIILLIVAVDSYRKERVEKKLMLKSD